MILPAALPGSADAAAKWRPRTIYVVVHTRRGMHVGQELRYGDGTFRLHTAGGERTIAESDVVRIAFLKDRRGGGPAGDPALFLATTVATRGRRPLRPKLPRGIFFESGQPVEESFQRAVAELGEPEAAALLCAELVVHCALRKQIPAAHRLLQEAARRVRERRPEVAFVYDLMHTALLIGAEKPGDIRPAIVRLRESYPDQGPRIERFLRMVRMAEGTRGPRWPLPRPKGRPRPGQ